MISNEIALKADMTKVKKYLEEEVFSELDDGTKMNYELAVQEVCRTQCFRPGMQFNIGRTEDWLRGLPSGMAHAFMWCDTVKLVEDWTGLKCDWDNDAGEFDNAYWYMLASAIYEGGRQFA